MTLVPILRLVACIICVTCASSQDTQTYKVKTDGCSVTKTCLFFPSSCTAGDSNCEANRRIITWQKAANSSSTAGPLIEIEMRSSPKAGYIAIGFGRNSFMKDADAYYCTSTNTFGTAAITATHQRPSKSDLPSSVKSTASSQVDNSIHCRFQRPMAVSKPSTTGDYSYDLSTESFYILAAEGSINQDQSIGFHSISSAVTNAKINFTADFPADTPSPVTTPSTNVVTSSGDSAKNTESPQTTNKEKPTTNQQSPTTSSTTTLQTTSKAILIKSSVSLGWTILISTTFILWKC